MKASANGKTDSPLGQWKSEALARLDLHLPYGEWLTGKQTGEWLQCRDPRSPSGDKNPSSGVADGSGTWQRGTFRSFRDDESFTLIDFLVQIRGVESVKAAMQMIADWSGVRVPEKKPSRNGAAKHIASGAAATPNSPSPAYSLNWISSSEFAKGNFRPDWLIEKIFVSNEPGFCGGPNKSLKTSIMVDAAISLGSATPFLGKYRVPRAVRTGMLSGESGKFALQQTAKRVCEARGVALANINLFWEFCLPQLANLEHLNTLARSLKDNKIEVLLLDPLYLSLLAGNEAKGLQAGNLYEMGPLLLNVTKACLDVGTTPFLIHHTKKNLAEPFQPLELSEMAFSGCAEFARQWLLINRREPFDIGTGQHKLWVSVGGSEGQSQLLAVDVDEGILEDDFSGRKWEVALADPGTAREQAQVKREQGKEEKKKRQVQNDGSKVLAAMEKLDPSGEGLTRRKIRDKAGISDTRIQAALADLIETEIVECFDGTVDIGSGTKRKAELYRHLKHARKEEDAV